MATRNGNSTTNNANLVEFNLGTKIVWHTDRATSSNDAHAIVDSLHNLGTTATAASPFTIFA